MEKILNKKERLAKFYFLDKFTWNITRKECVTSNVLEIGQYNNELRVLVMTASHWIVSEKSEDKDTRRISLNRILLLSIA